MLSLLHLGHSLTRRSSRSRNHLRAGQTGILCAQGCSREPPNTGAEGAPGETGAHRWPVRFENAPERLADARLSPTVSAQPGPPSRRRAGRRPQPARSPGGRHGDSPLALGPRRRPRPRRLAPPRSSRREPPPRRGSGRAPPLRALPTQLDRDNNDTPTPQSNGKPVRVSSALG